MAVNISGDWLATRARAKVNLTLHILGRRRDGYHELSSLVAFAGVGDTLGLRAGRGLSLSVRGPGAQAAGPEQDNLVLKAARALARRHPGLICGEFELTKRLPVAAGLGGGSADAAGALRLLAAANGLSPDAPSLVEAAIETGADVAVCLESRARMMAGIGDRLGPVLGLPPLFAVLVNPGVALATADVFRALAAGDAAADLRDDDGAAYVAGGGLEAICAARNDLEPPALRLKPVIGEAMAELAAMPACRLARMSGSGATIFGLFDDCRVSSHAARQLRARHPGWWVKATVLR